MESPAAEEAKFPVAYGEVKTDHVMNGLSNGVNNKSDSHHKHKHKDKEREREKHSSRKDKSSKESSERRYKDERKDKDRDREKEKSEEHRDKDHHKSSKHRESGEKVKDEESAEKNKENNDKEHKDKSKNHSDSHDSKWKEHRSSTSGTSSSKSHSSSSSSKDKHNSSSSSSKDKYEHSSDIHKDRLSTTTYDKHSSSSSKHSWDKKISSDKDRSDKHKDRSESDKKLKEQEEKKVKSEPIEVKKEAQDDSWSEVFDKHKSLYNDSVKQEMKSEAEEDEETGSQGDETEDLTDANYDSFIKSESDSEDDVPSSQRSTLPSKRKSYVEDDDDEDDVPLSALKKVKKEKITKKHEKKPLSDDEFEDRKPKKSQTNKKKKKEAKTESKQSTPPTKKKKKEEEEEHIIWKWWEEEKKEDGVKWRFLEHKGPLFAPPYERLPEKVKFCYDDKAMKLSQDAEEIAIFCAPLINHDYSTKEQFNKNFFKDWRKAMTKEEKEKITDLTKCNFREIQEHFKQKSEERKAMSKEEKLKRKEENEAITKEYGFCTIDGHKEKIDNFKIEPPGLFCGRGEHPKMGILKKRVQPEDVIINCSKDAKVPKPPEGRRWKEVRHDNSVTWLASWIENVQGQVKYVMLNSSSKLKGEKDWQKYETARKLAKCVDKVRDDYKEDSMYFIDEILKKHANELMEEVFRIYNVSITLQNPSSELADRDASLAEKILQYNRADRPVAIKSSQPSCGHISQSFDPPLMQIFVRVFNGKYFIIEADPLDTILRIKYSIAGTTGIPLYEQRLIFAGKQLDEQRTLEDYLIEKHSTIHVALRIRGGGFRRLSRLVNLNVSNLLKDNKNSTVVTMHTKQFSTGLMKKISALFPKRNNTDIWKKIRDLEIQLKKSEEERLKLGLKVAELEQKDKESQEIIEVLSEDVLGPETSTQLNPKSSAKLAVLIKQRRKDFKILPAPSFLEIGSAY